MTELGFSIGFFACAALGWFMRGVQEIRREQDITHQLFQRAMTHEEQAWSEPDAEDAALALGKARACVDAAALIAGINSKDLNTERSHGGE